MKDNLNLIEKNCFYHCIKLPLLFLCFFIVSCTQEVVGGEENTKFSVFSLISECDLLAAHPFDPERMADGVTDDEIVPRLAIIACEDALAENENEPRHLFHMGRAMLALGRKDVAKDYFEKAANQNYAAALAYLGDIYQFGLSVTANENTALEYYKKAVKGEFLAAEEQIKQLSFDSSLFVSNSIGKIYDRTFDVNATAKKPLLRNYIFNVIISAMDECGPFLKPNSLARFYLFRYPKNSWSIDQEEDIRVSIQTSIGEFDAEIFLDRYGCDGPVAKRLFKNINYFFGSYQV